MIIGTAGHVDHGKTTLVRALTGVDTDRLKEEKARGISIELGYAYVKSIKGPVLGFVDVPGHERLVHTMVAGASGIDVALLVVAADDGVMPQTREHLAILGLLGVTRAVIALTKADRVEPPRLEEVREEVQALLEPTPLASPAVFCTNATQGADPGVRKLLRHLEDLAAQLPQRRADRLFRMAIDRVFTLPGHGTIVAGTVLAGVIREHDTVSLLPGGAGARVRSVHAQNQAAVSGRAGERCALNLTGIEKRMITRGDWLAAPGLLKPTLRLDVRLQLLSEAGCEIRALAPLHVHLGTCDRLARVVPLEASGVAPGQSCRAQLVFDTAVCAQLGDRFIVRNPQSTQTVGGGWVLDPDPPARRRHTPQRLRYLDALEQLHRQGDFAALLEECPAGVAVSELTRLTGLPPEQLVFPAQTLRFSVAHGSHVVLSHYWNALRERVLATLRDFHLQFPDEPGPDVGRLRRMAAPRIPVALWEALVTELVEQGQAARAGPCLHLPHHAAQLSAADRLIVDQLLALISGGGFDPPWVRELAAAVRQPEERVRSVLRKQVILGQIYQVVPDLFYAGERVAQLAQIAGTLVQQEGALSASRFRDCVGLGRKRSIQILEFFNRVGYTRRIRDRHVLRRDSGWSDAWKAHAPGGAAGLQTQEGAPSASW